MNNANDNVKTELVPAGGAMIGIGGAATAAAVLACCAGPTLGPLVIALLGVGPAVGLEGLRPYAFLILIGSGIFIGLAFWLNARQKSCGLDRYTKIVRVASRALTWISATVWVGAITAVVWARLAY